MVSVLFSCLKTLVLGLVYVTILFNGGGGFFVCGGGWIFRLMVVVGFGLMVVVGFFCLLCGWVVVFIVVVEFFV